MKNLFALTLVLTTGIFYSCDNNKKPTREYGAIENTADDSKIEYGSDENYVIGDDGFMGLKLGSNIDTSSPYLKDESASGNNPSGYGLYNDKDQKIGNVYPRFNDESVISTIEITSPEYRTTKGINVGSTFRELENAYPNIVTNGSAADGKTTSRTGNYKFILDATFENYEIDASDITPDTKIKKIVVSESK